MARIDANLSDVKDEDMGGGGGWTAWEQGEYELMIAKSDYVPCNNGMMLKMEMVCLSGQRETQRQFVNLILQHPSEKAVQIARAKLKELAIAVGHLNPDLVEDSEELHGVPFLGFVTKKKAKESQREYADPNGFQNEVVGFKAIFPRAPGSDAPPPHTDSDARIQSDDIPF